MGRIQSNVGLITGIPITDTIDQLMGVSGRPRDVLTSRTQGLQQEQVAINSLSSRVLSLRFDLDRLKSSDPFQSRTVTSSNTEVLSASLNGNSRPPVGNFALRAAQTANSQQFVSQRFESIDDIQAAGSFSFGSGRYINQGIALDELNEGNGVARGEIKITDLQGNSSIVDLSLARTVDDVIRTINNDSTINVTASTDGDSFSLVDNIGGTGTLSVQEVNSGTTGADLGLTSITTTIQSEVVAGDAVYRLHSGTKLNTLNDGNGVYFTNDSEDIDDLVFTFRDGSLDTNDSPAIKFGVDLSGATTLGDVVDAINNDEDLSTRVSARIADDGNRLELTDLTTDSGGTFTVDNGTTGTAAEDLGLKLDATGDTLTGGRIVAGLNDTLVSSLNGGKGIDQGSISITDRADNEYDIDLSGAETLSELVEAINSAAPTLTATINSARSGIVITDNSEGGENLRITNGGASTTATDLGIEFDDASSSVDSGSLGRQSLSEATLLSSLNGGEGITPNDIRIHDSNGKSTSIDLNATDNEAQTIGDVIAAINASSSSVVARINDRGDGILLTDTGTGNSTLRIEDINGSLAEDLNLTRASETVEGTQIIDGTSSFSVDLSTISTSGAGVQLSSLNDGAGINRGDIVITDSKGNKTALDLNGLDSNITTVQGIIDAINARSEFVTASINEAGTGIQLTDTSGGEGTLLVEDRNGSAAADLRILSTDSTTTSINGSGLFAAQTASQGALNNVATQINNLDAGVTASVFSDGQGFRLQIVVNETGEANQVLVDSEDSGFQFTETSQARDALLVIGAGATAGSGVLVSSSTNEFSETIAGVNLTINAVSDTPVDVRVKESDKQIVEVVQSFIAAYNTLRDDLGELTAFDEEDLSTGLLFGTTEALRVDSDLSRLVTNRYRGLGSFDLLQDIGINVNEAGKLSLDQAKLKEAFANDTQSLQNFFSAKEDGVVAKFSSAIDRLTNADNGLLTNRNNALQSTIDLNNARIERFNESLERERTRLELEFFQLEQVIAGLQSNREAIGSIQAIPALSSTGAS